VVSAGAEPKRGEAVNYTNQVRVLLQFHRSFERVKGKERTRVYENNLLSVRCRSGGISCARLGCISGGTS
jgi:hypothetical protein